MRTILCDRCGKQTNYSYAEVKICNAFKSMFSDFTNYDELELCYDCSKSLRKWIKKNINEEEVNKND